MKKIIIKNGLLGVSILMGIQLITYLVYGTPDSSNFDLDELIGYISIVSCLLFVFIGIRQYHLIENNNSFIKSLGIGAAIATFPSVAFGLYSVIYYKWLNPSFLEEYNTYQLKKMKSSLSPEEFEITKAKFTEDMALWDSVWMQFGKMFLTVLVIGLIISLLTSMYFQVKPIRK